MLRSPFSFAAGTLLQVPGVPSGPSPIATLLSLLVVLVVLVVLGYVASRIWRRLADYVRYDDRTRE